MNDEQKRICAELGHIQKYFEAKADTCIGQGKMLLLNWANVVRDALELLKGQEEVTFKAKKAGTKTYPFWDVVCSGCGYTDAIIHEDWKYCPNCGKKVKWKCQDINVKA